MSGTPPEPTPQTVQSIIVRYILAVRPPFLTASLVPGLIGLATANFSGIRINALTAALTLIGPVLAQAGANVLNDYFDDKNGTDEINTERLFPFTGGSRMIQNGLLSTRQMLIFGTLLLATATLMGLALIPIVGPKILWFIVAGLFISWAYSAPPLKLNSRGLGEICIALAFGLFIPLGADFVQRGELSMLPLIAGLPFAMLVTNILYINQFPDRKADAAVGKNHLVVRLGADKARWLYLIMALIGYVSLVLAVLFESLPIWGLLGLISAPLSLFAAHQLLNFASTPERLVPAIKMTILATISHAVLISTGLVIG
ncbi:MAG: 1,4-dihydroxy-2-naphthoate octaprenyltransferase [Magnetococcales bacterium]|nr:1,4-dihydroxy-2-naphthoate octaprenyltransferase [Magnetococcales bacterium]